MYPKPIFWHSGQFLEPQHFQDTDWYHRQERAELLRCLRPHFEGVARLDANPAALAEGVLAFDRAELFFPDGTHVLWTGRLEDGNALPLRRALPELKDGALLVHARLDSFRERRNVAGLNKADIPSPAEHPERYDARPDPVETPDRYAQDHPTLAGDERALTRLYHNVRLLWDDETGDAGGMTLPLARLVDKDGGAALDPAFLPPLAVAQGSEWLPARLRRCMRMLADFPRRMEDAAGGAPTPAELFVRQAAAGLLADLDTLLATGKTPTWELYRALRRACAEMIAAARPAAGAADIPAYDHRRPGNCLPQLVDCCERLLAAFLPEVAAAIDPEYADGMLLFTLPEAAAAPGAAFRLAVRAEEPLQIVLAEGRLIAGAPDAVRDAVKLALPKLPLSPVPAPRGLPSKDGTAYLAVDERDRAWRDVLAARRLAVAYFPGRAAAGAGLASLARLYILRGGAL